MISSIKDPEEAFIYSRDPVKVFGVCSPPCNTSSFLLTSSYQLPPLSFLTLFLLRMVLSSAAMQLSLSPPRCQPESVYVCYAVQSQ